MIVDLIRHADTGRRGHLDGRSDPPLLPGALAPVLSRHVGLRWSHIVTSPLTRALSTAAALSQSSAVPVEVDPRWAELDFGAWDGLPSADVDPDALAAFHEDPGLHGPPGGEGWDTFRERVRGGLEDVFSELSPVLIVSHAATMRMALSLACGLPIPSSWAIRIDYGTRLRLSLQHGAEGLWGELLEIVQP
ncbi:MAG: histidine phosphatase family protein [Propionibacteriaceae bacterium]|nr:histidine phosphatase family protein [Propionibacteriaceae bacterium]